MKQFSQYLADQLACPRGFAGQWLAKSMDRDQTRRSRAEWAVELLELSQDDQVLEVGFGTGYSLELIARQIPLGALVGIDHSSLMVKRASERLAAYKADMPLALITAGIEDPPNLGQKFNRVLAVNSLMYWADKEKCLRQIRSLMQPDGRILIVHQPGEPEATEETTRRAGRGISKLLELTGFQEVRSEINLGLTPVPAVAVSGYS